MFHRLKSMLNQNKKTDFEYWQNGEKMLKFPWVIKYYENITDLNQYKYGMVCQKRATTLILIVSFICGMYMMYLLFDMGVF